MNRRKPMNFGAALCVAGIAAVAAPAVAQQTSFQSYRCADGSQFIVGFFEYDKRAHMQIDGKAVTLAKRLNWSGSRYSGDGVTLTIGSLDTLKSQLGWCFYHLATHPEDQRRLVESSDLIPGAVEEFLRAYPIVSMARKVTRDRPRP